MSKKSEIFLGKKGKIFGPYKQDEFDRMFAEGTLSDYSWIWDHGKDTWKPIEAPPAAPPLSGREAEVRSGMNWDQVRALCFDRFALMSGKLQCVTESGCELISENKDTGAKFPINCPVELSLYDSPSQKSMTITAYVTNIDLQNQSWVYRLKWKEVPCLA